MRRFTGSPTDSTRAGSILRGGALACIAGLLVLSITLFTDAPLLLLLSIAIGCLFVVAGCLAWFFSSRHL